MLWGWIFLCPQNQRVRQNCYITNQNLIYILIIFNAFNLMEEGRGFNSKVQVKVSNIQNSKTDIKEASKQLLFFIVLHLVMIQRIIRLNYKVCILFGYIISFQIQCITSIAIFFNPGNHEVGATTRTLIQRWRSWLKFEEVESNPKEA